LAKFLKNYKKTNTLFFFFLKNLFKKKKKKFLIIKKKKKKSLLKADFKNLNFIQGIKFILCGKLKGKPRKSRLQLLSGLIPCQKIDANIHYAKLHTYNRYGAFGFKL